MTPANGKNVTKYDEKFKITDFLLGFGFRSRILFVGIVMLHECNDFHTCSVKRSLRLSAE